MLAVGCLLRRELDVIDDMQFEGWCPRLDYITSSRVPLFVQVLFMLLLTCCRHGAILRQSIHIPIVAPYHGTNRVSRKHVAMFIEYALTITRFIIFPVFLRFVYLGGDCLHSPAESSSPHLLATTSLVDCSDAAFRLYVTHP